MRLGWLVLFVLALGAWGEPLEKGPYRIDVPAGWTVRSSASEAVLEPPDGVLRVRLSYTPAPPDVTLEEWVADWERRLREQGRVSLDGYRLLTVGGRPARMFDFTVAVAHTPLPPRSRILVVRVASDTIFEMIAIAENAPQLELYTEALNRQQESVTFR